MAGSRSDKPPLTPRRIANAGHPPWLLIRNGAVHPLEQSGLLLGIVADGVTEARSQDQRLFHATGISNVVRRQADESPETRQLVATSAE